MRTHSAGTSPRAAAREPRNPHDVDLELSASGRPQGTVTAPTAAAVPPAVAVSAPGMDGCHERPHLIMRSLP
jgi:hypothetical protein